MDSVIIGAHVSSAGGIAKAILRGEELGARSIQLFTESPRAWRATVRRPGELAEAAAALERSERVQSLFTHVTYLVNLASPNETLYRQSVECLARGLRSATLCGATGAIVHPGSHMGEGFNSARKRVAAGVVTAIRMARAELAAPSGEADDRLTAPSGRTGRDRSENRVAGGGALPLQPCPVLLENTAGQGGAVGANFYELAALIQMVGDTGESDNIGVCIDTQHLWAAGIRYADRASADQVIEEIDASISLDRVKCFHLNDSVTPFGARSDRHANIGEGTVGKEGLGWLISHPRLSGKPALLEVPGENRKGPRKQDIVAAVQALEWGVSQRST